MPHKSDSQNSAEQTRKLTLSKTRLRPHVFPRMRVITPGLRIPRLHFPHGRRFRKLLFRRLGKEARWPRMLSAFYGLSRIPLANIWGSSSSALRNNDASVLLPPKITKDHLPHPERISPACGPLPQGGESSFLAQCSLRHGQGRHCLLHSGRREPLISESRPEKQGRGVRFGPQAQFRGCTALPVYCLKGLRYKIFES